MGIERFFSSIEQNNITNLITNFTYKLEKKLDAKYLYIDFNSIVYITSNTVIYDLNYLLYQTLKNSKISNNKKLQKINKDYQLNLPDNLTVKLLRDIVNDEILDDIVVNKVYEYVINILNNFIDNKKLEFLYIAVDGVPSKSKMIEQKKRRYMGMIISEIKDLIFQKYEDQLKKYEIRYQYETNKFQWSRANITPGTLFMDKLDNMLNGIDFEINIKEVCPNMQTYIYSGAYEPGEGEKKIVDHLISLKNVKSDYVIYSPDSDVTLLGLILNTTNNNKKISPLKLLRHNQQSNNYDVIDVDKLNNNIFKYVKDRFKNSDLNSDNVINDIVFVLTIFGNDFVPKLESFNVKYDFDRIINKYTEVLKIYNTVGGNIPMSPLSDSSLESSLASSSSTPLTSSNTPSTSPSLPSTNKYLINMDNHRRTINQDVLISLFKELHLDEGGNLQKMYMASHYQNYDKLKKILGANQVNFTSVINQFLEKLRQLNDDIKNKKNISKWSTDDIFIKQLMKLTRHITGITSADFLKRYEKYYEINNKYPIVGVTFRSYSRSLKNPIYQDKLQKSLEYLDSSLKITPYDEEVFKFDNMLDEYSRKFNASAINLGYVNIDPQSYVWKTEKIENSVKRYYDEYFGIRDIDVKNTQMKKLLHEYIEGLVWVFDYYFNNFDINKNRLNANIWYYNHSHGPLLRQLYFYMQTVDDNYIKNIQDSLHKYNVPRIDYFNCLEHLMYVSPVQMIKNLIPKEYEKMIKNKEYYVDLEKIVDKIWHANKTSEIDCKGSLFLTKCHFKAIDENLSVDESYKRDLKFIKEIRLIKLPNDVNKLTGNFSVDKTNVVVHKYNK